MTRFNQTADRFIKKNNYYLRKNLKYYKEDENDVSVHRFDAGKRASWQPTGHKKLDIHASHLARKNGVASASPGMLQLYFGSSVVSLARRNMAQEPANVQRRAFL